MTVLTLPVNKTLRFQMDPQEIRRLDKKRALKLVLRQCKEQEFIRKVFKRFDRLESAAATFAFLLTEHFPHDEDGSLVAFTLDQAAAACGQAINTGHDPDAKERAFLLKLIESAEHLNRWKIIGSSIIGGRKMAWPGIDIPIIAWMKLHGLDMLEFHPQTHIRPKELDMSAIMAFKLLALPEIDLLANQLKGRLLHEITSTSGAKED
ncbi:hypothetical protein HA052_04890 [Chromobacterium haemolyticum]|uniref:Uncharacterized protein n=1 Tax=Chromobacterium fluminis TaxID=3044269 RepID=A0ABX0L4F7_9NEIS|nr:hypothetical protein [Chromobacterium haemolyticum]NHR04527.1 hypothetical protein [Chromobacterium haemolyticum]